MGVAVVVIVIVGRTTGVVEKLMVVLVFSVLMDKSIVAVVSGAGGKCGDGSISRFGGVKESSCTTSADAFENPAKFIVDSLILFCEDAAAEAVTVVDSATTAVGALNALSSC